MPSERGATETRDMRLETLLEMLDEQELVLPEFQRDFDWGDERVRQLLATITRRWPAGSLLLQQFPESTFYELREFDGGPPVKKPAVEYVVLDGQQRLTALYHAIYDSGPYVYAISANALQPGQTVDRLEDGIASFSRKEWDKEMRDRSFSEEHDWIPFYALRSAADYFGWRDSVVAEADPEDRSRVGALLSEAYVNGLEAFHSYMLPAVIVNRDLEPEAIARIFERVNRGGLRLGAFDLMVAKTFEPGWNLREKWDEARSDYPILANFFAEDGMPVIRVIALKANASVRERDVLGLEGLAVRHDWPEAVAATASAVGLLTDVCGVRRREWLPYEAMVLTLAAVAYEFELKAHATVLRQWVLSRAFALSYETAANTVAVDQHKHLRQVLTGETRLRPEPISSNIIREATRKRRGALWRAFLCALTTNDAHDVVTGQALVDPRPVPALPFDPDPPPGSESQHLLILNLLLAEPDSEKALAGVGPAGVREFLSALPARVSARTAKSQFLDSVDASATRNDQFLEGRLQGLNDFLVDELGYGLDAAEGE